MANGTDGKETVVDKVRPRLKREFEFAFRAHSEICGSLGRTRSSRAVSSSSSPPISNTSSKRLKAYGRRTCMVKKDEKVVFDLEDEGKIESVSDSVLNKEESENGMVLALVTSPKEKPNSNNGSVPMFLVDEDLKSDEPESVRENGVVETNSSCDLKGQDDKKENGVVESKSSRDLKGQDDKKDDACEEGTSGVVLMDEDSKGTMDVVLERKSESEAEKDGACKEGTSGAVMMDGDSKMTMDIAFESKIECELKKGGCELKKGDAREKETGGLSSVSVNNGKGGVNGTLQQVLVNGDGSKKVVEEEKPVRRFTRSAVKQKGEVEKDDACEEGTSGVAVMDGVAKATMDMVLESKSECGSKKGEDLELKIDNACEEGTSGLSLVSVKNSEGGVNGSLQLVLGDDNDSKKVAREEKPFRRFTRSALKQKDGVEKYDAYEVGTSVVAMTDGNNGEGGINGSLQLVLVDGDSSKEVVEEEKLFRRFTRSALKQKAEVEKDDVCEEGTGGVAMMDGDSKATMDIVLESKSECELKQGECELEKDDACEEGTSGLSLVLVNNDEAVVNGSLQLVLVDGDSSKKLVEEEKSFRRFTRSTLKSKMEVEEKDGKVGDAGSSSAAATVANAMPSKILTNDKKFRTKLKDLFDTGLLEGLKVKYMRGARARGSGEKGLHGMIKGSGILCFCDACKGNEVVTPTVFELHAGSANKRPQEYICLENGNTLRDVMIAWKGSSLETLNDAIRHSVGCSPFKKSNFCLNCRGLITEASSRKFMALCNQCMEMKDYQTSSPKRTDAIGTPKRGPVSESSDNVSKCSTSRSKSHGKVTTKDLRMHKLVFEEDVLPDGTEVGYYCQGKKLLVGYKKGFGIFCSCCNTEVSPSTFEAHAGFASRRKPYLNIYTSNGVSLHELSLSLSKARRFSIKENDDLCQICRDGGKLLCCDTCPRAFHPECLSLPSVPKGKWYCKFCLNLFERERYVEHNANAIAAGRVAGVDPIEQITRRCIRIVKTFEDEVGGCVFCRGHDFERGFGTRTVIICDQCEKEYHVGCLKEHMMVDLKELPKGKWFCCTGCEKIHSALQKLIIRGEEKLPDSSLNVVRKKHEEIASESSGSDDIKWRLLNKRTDSSSFAEALLSEAVAIFHERFDPIRMDNSKRKGDDHDLIPSMVNGGSFRGQDLGGMYCAVLLVNNVVVSAAIVRIFGQELAELPIVATSTKLQGLGYFQTLFTCIEKLLGFLNVKNLVLPAAEEAESLWKNKFGFNEITQDELMEYRKSYQIMVFQGAPMLQKSVPKCRVVGKSKGG